MTKEMVICSRCKIDKDRLPYLEKGIFSPSIQPLAVSGGPDHAAAPSFWDP
jgi:hypothetical protein